MTKIAELRHGILLGPSVDVFSHGPVLDRLLPGLGSILSSVWQELLDPPAFVRREWRGEIREQWIAALCRTLLRTDGYRHGGAFIISANTAFGVNTKHQIDYSRLRNAIVRQAARTVGVALSYEGIDADYLIPEASHLPVDEWLDYEIEKDELEDCVRELDGTTRFVSLLTQVDGAVLMTPSFEIKGFGVEITAEDPPPSLKLAGDRTASSRRLVSADYNHYGTRHRSMMRYCWAVPESIGLVISSDGGVRAIARVGDDVVMWNDVQLEHESSYDPVASARMRRLRKRIKRGSLPADASPA
ncbi:MAG: hypothetical protein WD274_09845 [Acidimicrobiia bacterium]